MHLRYNYEQDRYGVWQGGDWYIEGLHCGMCFHVLHGGAWVPVRIEYGPMPWGDDWYLIGIPGDVDLRGLEVRFAS